MDYYNDSKNVEAYIKMAAGYDGRSLIDALSVYLPDGSSILELGMGPGKDLKILAERYTVTGSDSSAIFLGRYKEQNPDADLLLIDAVVINVQRQFDCIYSNKVLHHLTRVELTKSLQKQAACLNQGGLLFHSFWYGDKEEQIVGLQFIYYTCETLLSLVGSNFEVVACQQYSEMDDSDSLYLILKKVV